MYRGLPVRPLLSDPFLGLEHWNSCSKGYRPDMKIPYLDPWSTLKTGPDDTQIISFGGGHLTLSSAPWTILAVSQAIGQLWGFRLDILTLLKKWVQAQIEPSKLGNVTQPFPYTHPGYGCMGTHNENFKFPSSDLDSPWKMGLDTSWTIPIGEHCLTLSSCPYTVLGIADATGQIGSWDLDILNPLEKWV
jgi:hypothetical protein